MSLQHLRRIRSLQRKLYRKAKAEPAYRFYALYDKICREDILRHAYALARSNAGAPGVDAVTFADMIVGREGGACLPLLCALRQDLSRGHSPSWLCVGPRQCGCARHGWNNLCRDRGVGPG